MNRATSLYSTRFPIAPWLLAVVAIGLTLWQWGPVLNADWSIRDDYRFVSLMSPGGRIDFKTFLEQCNPPQDWHLGSMVNRPTYYSVHSFLMWSAGNHIAVWQLFKLTVFCVAIFTFGIVLLRYVRLPAALGMMFAYTVHPLWSDIVPRANSEIFAAASLPVFLLGYLALRDSDGRMSTARNLIWVAVTAFSGVALAGSKENFTPITVALCTALIVDVWYTRDRAVLVRLLAILPGLIWGTIVAGYIFAAIRRSAGQNLYGKPLATFEESLQLIGVDYALRNPIGLILFLGFLLGAFVLSRRLHRKTPTERRERALRLAAATTLLFGFGAFLFYFYSGTISGTRYAYPYQYLPFALLAVLGWYAEPYFQRHPATLRIVGGVACAGFVALGLLSSPSRNLARARDYETKTRHFQSQINAIVAAIGQDQQRPILFESYACYDQEAVASVVIYLRSRRIQNPFFLEIVGYSEDSYTDHLSKHMVRLIKGMVGPGKRFRDAAEIPASEPPLRVTFSRPQEDPAAITNVHMLY